MGKFNIRRATKRTPDQSKKPEKQEEIKVGEAEPSNSERNNEVIIIPQNNSLESLNKQFGLFESIVSHNYLTKLDSYPIVAPSSESLPKMGWHKITKIVLAGDSFFPDQLSMLYTALHDVAQTVALVVEKKSLDDIEIYLGARDFSGVDFVASNLLNNSIQGFLPGVRTQMCDKRILNDESVKNFVASYSGIASLRDDKKENFIQGIEKFIDATPSIPTFTAIFVAENVSNGQANSMIDAYSSIADSFSPLTQSQETISQSETEGVSRTITDTIGETLTETLSKTVTRTEGTNTNWSKSDGITVGKTENSSPNIIESFVTKFLGGVSGTSENSNRTTQAQEGGGKHTDFGESDGKSDSTAKMKQQAVADGTNSSKTTGSSIQITRSNNKAKRYVDILDRQVKRLQNGMPFGLWSVGTYFVSQDPSTSEKLANIYQGCVTGEGSEVETSAVNVWGEKESSELLKYLRDVRNPRFLVGSINVSAASLATSKELAIHMSLPQTSISGVEVRESATFGRNIAKKSDECIKIGYISHLGNVSTKEVLLSTDELGKHTFVTGSTGSGKSNTVYLLVKQFLESGKHVMIVEPTKGDYKKVFGGRDDVTVYGTRIDEKNLLTINPFAFPDNIKVVEHVERLVEIFGVCWPMYAAMPAVLKDSILSAYEACGWNLRTSTCKHAKLFPTISDVITQLKHIISTSEYSADTKGDYIGALQTRLQSLTNGVYSSILQSASPIPYDKLYDSNVIIDLHNIGSSETRSLLMGLLILGLSEWRMSKSDESMDVPMHHVTILEEAHCILPRVSKQQSQEGSNVIGKSVEMIASAIAEMRTYGESFVIVDQSPSAVDESAIRNTNTKIIMNLPDGDDREIAGKSMGLTKESQFNEISRFDTGEAIVWQRGWSEAVMCQIDEVKNEDKKPLLKKDNRIEITDDEYNVPSSSFLAKFFKNDDSVDSDIIKEEILSAKCPSVLKASLLEISNSPVDLKIPTTRDALIDYLGLKDFFKSNVVKYTSGSSKFIEDIRGFMSNNLRIKDSKTQDILLSQLFIWASKLNKKWHKFCSQCMPSNNINR
ncbi:MAG: DUF87 domain-containing protein [Muribaculaceae bacterium]|nr:DUF87 domain-containing protein [Muribaculaceae bacterium]